MNSRALCTIKFLSPGLTASAAGTTPQKFVPILACLRRSDASIRVEQIIFGTFLLDRRCKILPGPTGLWRVVVGSLDLQARYLLRDFLGSAALTAERTNSREPADCFFTLRFLYSLRCLGRRTGVVV
jgi:hypothetical protein